MLIRDRSIVPSIACQNYLCAVVEYCCEPVTCLCWFAIYDGTGLARIYHLETIQ